MKDALSYQVQQLLKENNLNIDFNELNFQIQSHPTYPSLHAITGVLDHFNIENIALDVPKTIETLNQLPDTFLAQVDIEQQKQFVVVTKSKNNYRIVFGPKNQKTIAQHDFLDQFTGIVLAVDENESNRSNTSNSKSAIVKTLSICTVLLFGFILINSNLGWLNLVFFLTSVFGIYITTTIIKQEQGESTMLGNAFCSNPTEKKSCDAVLSSKGATIFKGFKLTDLSFIFFSGLSLTTFLLAISNNTIFIPKLITVAALPITIYSIYYQYAVIQKWCFLCLSIVGLMWFQVGLSLLDFNPNYKFTSILISALSFTSIGALWFIISEAQKANKTLNQTKLKYFKFKRNFELFSNQLNKSKVINTHIDNTKEIVYGNRNSHFNITIITNPMCGHCRTVHDLVTQISNRYLDVITLTIRFNVDSKNADSPAVKVSTRLLELYQTDGPENCLNAMNDIYGDYSAEQWLKKWQNCFHPEKYLTVLQKEDSWCSNNNINFTPEILINGQSYPKIYDRKDLIYFIDDLAEQFESNSYNIPFVRH
ncbi:vitamin K epoxide reductase family protein [Psychroserpens luteolus]|uniref:vitamin K epoxide reductase family protein n=1 Tax=Psychroserpens luteolus TaxID=2855840 RepID=UPI001E4269C1|nr:vitamin K epoxide reductase family protein [Psychroserpens luteolus]MCD2260451.1 thioredoxin domain-containing protein [Psychroserpens luteolus]